MHRDLKPQNILISLEDPSKYVKIADFGLSKSAASGTISNLNNVGGTPTWRAPEISQGSTYVC